MHGLDNFAESLRQLAYQGFFLPPFLVRRDWFEKHVHDFRRLKGAYDPKAAARRDAIAGNVDARRATGTRYEDHLCVRAQQALDRAIQDGKAALQRIDFGLRRLPPLPKLSSDEFLHDARTRFDAAAHFWLAALKSVRVEKHRAERAITAFKVENSIDRNHRRKNRVIGVAGLVAAWCLEMCVNYNLLLSSGVGAGIQIIYLVLVTASLNLALGTSAGFFGARNIGHVKPIRRVLGWTVVITCTLLCLCLHVILARYRYEIDMAWANPKAASDSVVLIQLLSAAKLNIFAATTYAVVADVYADGLFAVGIALACFAAFDGYRWLSDPYPGFTDLHDALRETMIRERRYAKGLRKDVRTITSSCKRRLDKVASDARSTSGRVDQWIDRAELCMKNYEKQASFIVQETANRIDDYRARYRTIHQGPVPKYWSQELPRLNRELPVDMNRYSEIVARNQAALQTIEDQAHEIKTNLDKEESLLLAAIEPETDPLAPEVMAEDEDHDSSRIPPETAILNEYNDEYPATSQDEDHNGLTDAPETATSNEYGEDCSTAPYEDNRNPLGTGEPGAPDEHDDDNPSTLH